MAKQTKSTAARAAKLAASNAATIAQLDAKLAQKAAANTDGLRPGGGPLTNGEIKALQALDAQASKAKAAGKSHAVPAAKADAIVKAAVDRTVKGKEAAALLKAEGFTAPAAALITGVPAGAQQVTGAGSVFLGNTKAARRKALLGAKPDLRAHSRDAGLGRAVVAAYVEQHGKPAQGMNHPAPVVERSYARPATVAKMEADNGKPAKGAAAMGKALDAAYRDAKRTVVAAESKAAKAPCTRCGRMNSHGTDCRTASACKARAAAARDASTPAAKLAKAKAATAGPVGRALAPAGKALVAALDALAPVVAPKVTRTAKAKAARSAIRRK